MKTSNKLLAIALAVTSVATVADSAMAQRTRSTADRRQHPGGGFWANDAASRRISHAQDYSRGLQRYSQYMVQPNQPAGQPQPAGQTANVVVQPSHEMTTTYVREIGNNIAGAQERLLEVQAEAKRNEDQLTLDSLKSISQQLSSAAAEQKKCMEECKSGNMDMNAIMERCQAMTSALDKAKAEHEKLMLRLHPEMMSPSKPTAPPQE